jgi:hypothetical protein
LFFAATFPCKDRDIENLHLGHNYSALHICFLYATIIVL